MFVSISVATSSLEHTKDLDVHNCTGCCHCGGVRVFGNPNVTACPLLEGGAYNMEKMRDQHDRVISFRSVTVNGVLSKA